MINLNTYLFLICYTLSVIQNLQSAPTPQDNFELYNSQNYDPYFQYYQWPDQYYENDGRDENLQQIYAAYPLQLNSVSSEPNQNFISIMDDENKNIFGNIIDSFIRPVKTTTKRSPATSTTLKPNLVQQQCLEKCIERPPSQYNPVCGSNGETYFNVGRLDCAVDCGVDVTVARRGTCTPMVSSIVSGVPPA